MELISAILGPVLSFLLFYKYVAIFLIAFLSALALPLPSSTTLAAAGAFASQKYLDLPTVLIVAIIGNVLGDACGYYLARRFGIIVLNHLGLSRATRSKNYRKVERYIVDHPGLLIFFTRFTTTIGPIVNTLAGLSQMAPKKYFFYDVLGESLYVLLYTLFGFIVGLAWVENFDLITETSLIILLTGVIVGLAQWLWRRAHSR